MVYLVPLRRTQLAIESIQQHIEDFALTAVEGSRLMSVPEGCLAHYVFRLPYGLLQGLGEGIEEPTYPLGYVQTALLRVLQLCIVGAPIIQYLRGKTVIPTRSVVGTRKQ